MSNDKQLTGDEYVAIVLDSDFNFFVYLDSAVVWFLIIALGALTLFWITSGYSGLSRLRSFEIDEAQFGLGEQKFTVRPNETDRQIAYKIWVELSTRKIGLPIDLNNDVITEVYDSWYSFFSVTRELIKDVPVSKLRRKDTEVIIKLSIEVLNAGIRPHLTRWQARFRRWYARASDQEKYSEASPQDIQRDFPEYEVLCADLNQVNQRLIQYRKKMHQLISNP